MKIGRLFPLSEHNSLLADQDFMGIHFDSRFLQPGDVFLALKSDANDGHLYVQSALERGAAGAIVLQSFYDHATLSIKPLLIPVSDPMDFIRKLAVHYLKMLNLKERIVITGTNGKTSTKEFLYQILKSHYTCAATVKNYNNLLGLIYSILKMPIGTDYGIFEIGTNHPGEIAALAELLQPTIGIITSIGYGHIEFFHTLESIAREKCSLFNYMQGSSIAIYRANLEILHPLVSALPMIHPIYYSLDDENPALYHYISTDQGLISRGLEFNTGIEYFALHSNLAAAISCAQVLGMPDIAIQSSVRQIKLPDKRLNIDHTERLMIINDCYNANPDSMTLAILTVAKISEKLQRKAFLVLSDMLELGTASEKLHRHVGQTIAQFSHCWKGVLTFGQYALHYGDYLTDTTIPVRHYFEKKELWQSLTSILDTGDIILVKGSRGMALESITQELMKW